MDILDLAQSLPKISTPPKIIVAGLGLEYIGSQAGDYVAPELVDQSPQISAVRLIIAPAAAGKSTSAKAVCAVTGGIYADLGGRRVADGSFSGLLDEAIGERPALDYRDLLRQNSATYVIDSLDETQLKSGELSFIAFLQGLCRFARSSEGIGNVLLFARLDTAAWIIDTFDEEGVPLLVQQLDYFSESLSNRYLDLKLDRLYERQNRSRKPHRQYPNHYAEARDSVYRRIASVLDSSNDHHHHWDNPDAAHFLGYSPVLESIAAYLCVSDFRQLDLGELANVDADLTGPEWRILKTLISSLLNREQGRLQEGFIRAETLRESYGVAASTLYTPAEQCLRLVQQVDAPSQSIGLPAGLPPELQSSYDGAVATLLKNHPFLSSNGRFFHPVFRDYAYAVALTSIYTAEGLVRTVLRKLRDGSTLPSAALAPFIAQLVEAQGLGLPSTRCDLLLESLQSQEDSSFYYDIFLYAQGDTGLLEARRITSSGAGKEAAISVPLGVDNDGIRLPASCRHLRVDTDSDLEINAAGRVVRIGPYVDIRARTFTVSAADALTLDTNDGPVSIECELIMTPHLELRRYGTSLQVYADAADGSLSAYAKSRPRGENDDTQDTFYTLRRVLSFFRKTVHSPAGVLAADRGQIDTHLIGTNSAAADLVGRLCNLNLITVHQRAYHLHLDELASHGIRYDDFHTLPLSPIMRHFLSALTKHSDED